MTVSNVYFLNHTIQIPEKYAPVVVDYLSKVQGRVREVRESLQQINAY